MQTELSFLIRVGDFWWVSSKVGQEFGSLKAKVVSYEDSLMPPLKSWQYHVGGSKWESDTSLECSREVAPPCSEVSVGLHGVAKEKQPDCAGTYLPVEGVHQRGRPVGSTENHHHHKNHESDI